jgi:ATP-dependent helicase/nuclease subunit B
MIQDARKRLGDTAGVRFYHFYGLGQQILDNALQPVFNISDTTQRRLVAQIFRQMAEGGRLTTFLPVWETPGFGQVLINWLHEMKSQGIAPEAVQAHASASAQERDRQLAEFYHAYQEFLIRRGSSDADGLLWLAAEALDHGLALPEQPLLIALGFDHFNPLQVRILRAVAQHCVDLRMYIPWDAQRANDSLALTRPAQMRQTLTEALPLTIEALASTAEIQPGLAGIQRGVFEPAAVGQGMDADTDDGALRLIAAPSREREARWALRSIKQRLLAGTPLEQIALLAPLPDIYQRIVEVVAGEYGIPVQIERRLSETPSAAALLNLLGLSPDFPWRETLDALRSPYFTHPWLTEEQINQLDTLSRERPVLSGRDAWRQALKPLPPTGAQGGDDEDQGPAMLAGQLGPEALAAIQNGLETFFDLLTPPETASPRAYALWLQQSVLGLFSDDENEERPASLDMAGACQSGPSARYDVQALKLILRALATQVESNEYLSAPGEMVSWDEFRADLHAALLSLSLPVHPTEPGVRFAALETGRSLAVDHLYVLGLAEGEFPRLPTPDVLYSPQEREWHPLALVRLPSGEQASLWWQILNNCRQSLTLLRPRLDEKGAPWLPSSFWEAVTALYPKGSGVVQELELPIVAHPTLQDAASPAELLEALATCGAQAVPVQLQRAWHSSQAAAAVLRQRQSWLPVPAYEGVLRSEQIRAELGQRYGAQHNWSASRLNSYGKCPYAFYAQSVLKLEAVADPVEGFDALQRGTLLHAVLEDLFRQLTLRSIPPATDHRERVQELLAESCARIFANAPRRYGFRQDALWSYEQAELARLARVLVDQEITDNGANALFQPYHQEMRFGIPGGELPALTVTDEYGFSFLLHGVIDRIDRDRDGRLRLIDYKSGSTLYNEGEIRAGQSLQTALYALTAEQLMPAAVAESYFLHIPNRKASGKLRFNGGVGEDAIVGAAVASAAEFIQAVRDGRFPTLTSKAGEGRNGCLSTCEFAALCRGDRHAFAKARRGGAQ